MSHNSRNAPTVPYYAHPSTKPLRPKAPKEIPDWLFDKKISKSRTFQAIYAWIRANFSEGDLFFMGEGAPDHPTYRLLNRYGRFKCLKTMGNTRVMVDWQDEGHRIHVEVPTFYKYARKLDDQGEEINLPRIDFSTITNE